MSRTKCGSEFGSGKIRTKCNINLDGLTPDLEPHWFPEWVFGKPKNSKNVLVREENLGEHAFGRGLLYCVFTCDSKTPCYMASMMNRPSI